MPRPPMCPKCGAALMLGDECETCDILDELEDMTDADYSAWEEELPDWEVSSS